MICTAFEERVAGSLDGGLSAEERAELDEHLGGCASCRQLLDDLREDRELLAEPVPWRELDLEAIRHSVREEIAAEPTDRRSFRFAWAALVLLAVGLAWLSQVPGREHPAQQARLARYSNWAEVARSESELSIVPHDLELALPPGESPPAVRVDPLAPSPSVRDSGQVAPPEIRKFPEPTEARESMVIQWVSTDPGLVIYWLMDSMEKKNAIPDKDGIPNENAISNTAEISTS